MRFISLKPDELFGPGNAAIAAFIICNGLGLLFGGWWKPVHSIVLGLIVAEVIVLCGVFSQPEHGALEIMVGFLNGFLALVAAGIVSKVTAKVGTNDGAAGLMAPIPKKKFVHDWFDF
jgi:hypothetical protein